VGQTVREALAADKDFEPFFIKKFTVLDHQILFCPFSGVVQESNRLLKAKILYTFTAEIFIVDKANCVTYVV
jgi:hypothetical protein